MQMHLVFPNFQKNHRNVHMYSLVPQSVKEPTIVAYPVLIIRYSDGTEWPLFPLGMKVKRRKKGSEI